MKWWNIDRINKAQPWIIGMNLVISSVTLMKIFIYPYEIFTCNLNTYNTSQIICIKE